MSFIILTILLFSTIEVAVKLLNGAVDPILIAVIRFMIAGVLLALSSRASFKKIPLKDFIVIIVIGIIGIAGTFGPFHFALDLSTIDAKDAALIFSLNPLFAGISASIILKERLSLRYLAGIILGFAGVYLVIFGWQSIVINEISGPLFLISSAITFGLYTTFSKKYVQRYGARTVTAITFVAGALTLSPFVKKWGVTFSAYTVIDLFYLTIFTTYIGYLSFFHGLKKVPVAVGSSLFYFKPIIASILAVVILKETLTSTFIIGMVHPAGERLKAVVVCKVPVHVLINRFIEICLKYCSL